MLEIPVLQGGPAEAVASAARRVEAHAAHGPVTLVGSSLGGYYATWLAERYGARAVLLNPAILRFAGVTVPAIRPSGSVAPHLAGRPPRRYARGMTWQSHFETATVVACRGHKPCRHALPPALAVA